MYLTTICLWVSIRLHSGYRSLWPTTLKSCDPSRLVFAGNRKALRPKGAQSYTSSLLRIAIEKSDCKENRWSAWYESKWIQEGNWGTLIGKRDDGRDEATLEIFIGGRATDSLRAASCCGACGSFR